jgi:hypothetical protein
VKLANGILAAALAWTAVGCASSTAPPDEEPAFVSPADLVTSLADVANGRNADLAETGLLLKRIELRLLVGRERRGGARASFLVLDAGASRRTDTSFTQSFTLELPPPERRRAAAETIGAAFPAIAEFVDSAIAAARELVGAAERAGLPQRLRELELTARIVRSGRVEGGLAFTGLAGVDARAGGSLTAEETNTVRLVFVSQSQR